MIRWLNRLNKRREIERRVAEMEREADAIEVAVPLLGYVVALTEIQAKTLVSIAASKIDDGELAKLSLAEAALGLQALTGELRARYDQDQQTFARQREAMEALRKDFDHG